MLMSFEVRMSFTFERTRGWSRFGRFDSVENVWASGRPPFDRWVYLKFASLDRARSVIRRAAAYRMTRIRGAVGLSADPNHQRRAPRSIDSNETSVPRSVRRAGVRRPLHRS